MGNCIALSKPNGEILWDDSFEDHRILRIVKTDDKVLEYGASILVRDLLRNFEGYGVGVSRHASQHLPPEHELRIGNVYHLLPLGVASLSSPDVDTLAKGAQVLGSSCKRIKVVIKKQQLQEMLSKTISIEEALLSGIHSREERSISSPRTWKPQLETILEGSE